jgi:hypothetical protein
MTCVVRECWDAPRPAVLLVLRATDGRGRTGTSIDGAPHAREAGLSPRHPRRPEHLASSLAPSRGWVPARRAMIGRARERVPHRTPAFTVSVEAVDTDMDDAREVLQLRIRALHLLRERRPVQAAASPLRRSLGESQPPIRRPGLWCVGHRRADSVARSADRCSRVGRDAAFLWFFLSPRLWREPQRTDDHG